MLTSLRAIDQLAKAITMPYLGAKLMTSPGFIKWMTEGATLPRSQIAAHISRLGMIAKAEPAMRSAIHQYAMNIRDDQK